MIMNQLLVTKMDESVEEEHFSFRRGMDTIDAMTLLE